MDLMDLKVRYSPLTQDFDLALLNWDLEPEDGLETAVLLSLFTDARVLDEELPLGQENKRGFWGDAVNNPQGYVTGSKLWLLERTTITEELLEQAKNYCEEALQWLIDDSIATEVNVETSYKDKQTLLIQVEIVRPSTDKISSKFDFVWEGTSNGIQSANS